MICQERQGISIHALLAESDPFLTIFPPSCGNFYPRSPCGERRITDGSICFDSRISIHALLAESDTCARCHCWGLNEISIHALLAESDVDKIPYQRQIDQFLSTLSLRRATLRVTSSTRSHPDFYPRSPCGERRDNAL